MKNLIVITHLFPYSPPSEQFLKDEIPYLLDFFDSVSIFPASRNLDKNNSQKISNKIRIYPLKRESKFKEILTNFYFVFFSKLFWIELFTLYKKTKLFNFFAIKMFFMFSLNSEIIYKRMISEINLLKLKKEDQIYIYSYWLNHMSLSSVKLKLHLKDRGYENIVSFSRSHGSNDVFLPLKTNNYFIYKKYINDNIDMIYNTSEKGMDYLQYLGFNENLMKLFYLGIEDRFTHHEADFNGNLTIITCSSIIPLKRLDIVAKALKSVSNIPLNWVHFGDGPSKSDLKDLISSLPNNINVRLHGFIDNNELFNEYKKLTKKIFVNVSSIEGLPVSVIEATSASMPIVATDVGGNSEICIDGYNGYLLKKVIIQEDLIKTIKDFNNMPLENFIEFSLNSRKLYLEKFKADINHSRFANSISNLI